MAEASRASVLCGSADGPGSRRARSCPHRVVWVQLSPPVWPQQPRHSPRGPGATSWAPGSGSPAAQQPLGGETGDVVPGRRAPESVPCSSRSSANPLAGPVEPGNTRPPAPTQAHYPEGSGLCRCRSPFASAANAPPFHLCLYPPRPPRWDPGLVRRPYGASTRTAVGCPCSQGQKLSLSHGHGPSSSWCLVCSGGSSANVHVQFGEGGPRGFSRAAAAAGSQGRSCWAPYFSSIAYHLGCLVLCSMIKRRKFSKIC